MYALFSKQEKYNFVNTYGVVDYVWNIKGLSSMAKTIYQILLAELKRLHAADKLKVDDKGMYIELARTVIGSMVEKCSHTVAKYIKELQRYGLLIDRRMGVNLCNRIYLKYRVDAKRYHTEKSDNNKQKNNGAKPASHTPEKNNSLINKANEIIAQLTGECLAPATVNQVLKLCKDNLDDLNAAVEYCFGKTPKVSYVAMLFDTLRNNYQKKKEQRKAKHEYKSSSKRKPNGHFTVTESHGFDVDNLQKLETLRQQRDLGFISEEEFQSQLNKLQIYK